MIAQVKHWWKICHFGESKSIFAALAAHSGQVSVGLSQGFSAVLIPKLLESNFATEDEASWVASLGVISNPIGALVAGTFAEYFGRRTAVGFAAIPHAVGWLFIALATNVPLMYAGRFISGLGAGMANGLYLYVSEVAAAEQRGWLASTGPAVVSLGVLMAYTLGALMTWQNAAAISIIPAAISLLLVRTIPETPAWLAAKGRTDEAKKSLLWLRGPGVSTDAEHNELCRSNTESEMKKESVFRALHKPNVWKPFLTLFFFFALQQLSGIYIILFYAVTVLQNIGITIDEYACSVAIGGVRLFAAILGAGLARSVGRRPLACASGLGMALSAGGVAVAMRYSLASWIPLLCIGTHVAFSMIGYLTLPWVMTSELYLLRFRGPLGGLTTGLAQLMTFVAIKTYPDLQRAIGLENTMWIFSMSGLIGAIFALTILPETRGRSLHQIERAFSRKNNSYNADTITIEVQPKPKDVTLRKFTSIQDDRLCDLQNTIHWANRLGYDNLGLDVTSEHFRNNGTNVDISNENDQSGSFNARNNKSPYEHVYL